MKHFANLRITTALIALLFTTACSTDSSPTPPDPSGGGKSPPPSKVQQPAANPTAVSKDELFDQISRPLALSLDKFFNKGNQLQKLRLPAGFVEDSADLALQGRLTFADQIAEAVDLNFSPEKAQLSHVADVFGLSPNPDNNMAADLISLPFCSASTTELKHALRSQDVPNASTIALANTWVNKMNSARHGLLAGQHDSAVHARKQWAQFFMCISYFESLTTADEAFNDSVAKEVAPHDYVRPPGVEFYLDGAQSNPDSTLNIGLFQFSPNIGGETQACIDKWNAQFPQAPFPRNLREADLIRATGSSLQFFNAWCGVSKVSDMFAVQINTNQSKSTALANKTAAGKLLPPAQRCVTPFFGTWSYNHFGSLQNSLGNTMRPMLECALREL